MKLFSIVIPVYNVELYIEECLQSILNQIKNRNQFEILLIDDGSTDSSGQVCDKYSKDYPELIKVFHSENQGLLMARRLGFSKASGKYVVNCDSDDTLEYGMFDKLIEVINMYNQPDMIIFNYNSFDGERKICQFSDIFNSLPTSLISKETVLKQFLSSHIIVSMWCKVYKRELIDIDKCYQQFGNLSTGEDTLQSVELFSNAQNFVYLNSPLYNYRIGTGMTRKFDYNYYKTFKEVLLIIQKNKTFSSLENFDYLFLIKLFQIIGRTITQSRYNKWKNTREHVDYLKKIYNDNLFQNNKEKYYEIKKDIQRSHFLMLNLLSKKNFLTICIILKLKNYVWGKR